VKGVGVLVIFNKNMKNKNYMTEEQFYANNINLHGFFPQDKNMMMQENKISCEICGEKFKSYSGLENFHFGEKGRIYSCCEKCSKTIKQFIEGCKKYVKKPKTDEEIIKDCLLYCIHRVRNHPECGISGLCEWKTIAKILDDWSIEKPASCLDDMAKEI